ncbi:mitochondrial inner membrane protein Mpv17 [Onthophagus taurus]|uniref:mitochondrial inner membrane protein Mpv17 n=1 Tax=Onthophagus taurus TaxID=166361 RepID=UPI000C2076A0|nr:mpv17-like protein isoform X1 [Onthophagus taurus]
MSAISKIKPFLRPAIQTAILMSAGDIIAQTVIYKRSFNEIDLRRTRQFACLGFFLVGPTTSTWYRFLARKIVSTNTRGTLKKVVLDQCVFAPSFIVVLLYAIGLAKGNESEMIISDIKNNYKDVLITNYKLFPAVQLINFYFVPLKHQVLLVQFVALVFNTYLSMKTHSSTEKIVEK